MAAQAGLTVVGGGTQSLALVGFADEHIFTELWHEVAYDPANAAAGIADYVTTFATDDFGNTSNGFVIALQVQTHDALI